MIATIVTLIVLGCIAYLFVWSQRQHNEKHRQEAKMNNLHNRYNDVHDTVISLRNAADVMNSRGDANAGVILLALQEHDLISAFEPKSEIGYDNYFNAYNTFTAENDGIARTLKLSYNTISEADNYLKNAPTPEKLQQMLITGGQTVSGVTFSNPADHDLLDKYSNEINNYISSRNKLDTLLSMKELNINDIKSQVTFTKTLERNLKTFEEAIREIVRFDKAQKETAAKMPKTIEQAIKTAKTVSQRDGVSPVTLTEINSAINYCLLTMNNFGSNPVTDLQLGGELQNKLLAVTAKANAEINNMLMQRHTSHVSERTRETEASKRIAQERFNSSRPAPISRQNTNTRIRSTRTSDFNQQDDNYNYNDSNILDTAINIGVAAAIVEEIIEDNQPQPQVFGGGDFGGGGASGSWATDEPLYNPEPQQVYEEPSNDNYNSSDDDN